MQMDATDAFDVTREPAHIHEMYGSGTQARQLMIARRLLERGVRFVQVWSGEGQPWDQHDDLEVRHRALAQECDQPIAALIKDLQTAHGMLDDTLVICGGGRPHPHRIEIIPHPAPTPAKSTAAITTITASPRGWPAAA